MAGSRSAVPLRSGTAAAGSAAGRVVGAAEEVSAVAGAWVSAGVQAMSPAHNAAHSPTDTSASPPRRRGPASHSRANRNFRSFLPGANPVVKAGARPMRAAASRASP